MDGCRTVVGGACVVSGAEKKAFDRGGLVWPPRSNAKYDRLGVGVWGGFAPPAKNRGVWGAAPPSQNRKNEKKIKNISFFFPVPSSRYLTFQPEKSD